MALQSQGVVIRRESSAAGSTAVLSTNTIAFDSTNNVLTRQAGFADFSTGMRVQVVSSVNTGVFTISDTAATAITVYEPLTAEASGYNVVMTAHAMSCIGQVQSFNGPAPTANVIDITHLQSTAKEKLIGLQDSGRVSLGVIFENESSGELLHDALIRDMTARTVRKFDIKFTDNGSVSAQPGAVYFEGYVTGFAITGAVDNIIRGDITIDVSTGLNWIQPV